MVWVANSYSCGDLGLPGFCPVELCTVVLSADKVATGTLHDVYLKQTVRLRIDGYEPGGREFESLRARHNIKLIQQVISSPAIAFCFSKTSAGLLREFSPHTRLAASIRFSNSAAE